MDEKLSKGYAQQLMFWFDEDLKKAHKQFRVAMNESKKLFQSTKSFGKFCIKIKSIYKDFYFNYSHVKAKKNPFFAFVTFGPVEAPYKHWVEKKLEGIVGYFPFDGKKLGIHNAIFVIGEHTLARTFQRSKKFDGILVKNHYEILSEFKYVAIWVSFWELFKVSLQKDFLEFSPLIPSPNGLFFCEYEYLPKKGNLQVYRIHLRTYVGKDDLSEDQEKLRKLMLKGSENLENSSLAYLPHLVGSLEDQSLQDFSMLSNRVKSFLPQLSREIFKSRDDVELSIFINNSISLFKKYIPLNVDYLESELNTLGYEEFINKLILQKKHSKLKNDN